MSLINREALYEKACDLEAQALAYVGKIANDETKIEEWKIWSAILVERTAFKHDIFDAPSVQPERTEKRTEEHTETHACDCVNRQAVISRILGMTTLGSVNELVKYAREHHLEDTWTGGIRDAVFAIVNAPSVQPYTDEEIQKMQEMEQAEIKKAFELGREDAKAEIVRCKECKHWMPYDWMFSEVWQSQNMDDYPEDEIGCAYCDMNMSANDFCSRSERKTDEPEE